MTPIKISDVDIAFGAYGKMKDLLPAYATLPEDYQNERDPFSPLVNQWFGVGLKKSALKVKPGIDENDAWRHLKAIMGSFEPKHEHKIAGVAYLMSQWFDKTDGASAKQAQEHKGAPKNPPAQTKRDDDEWGDAVPF